MKKARVLFVENNPADVMVAQVVFNESKKEKEVTTVSDGEQALEYLRNAKKLPDIILLDLNMPRMDGRMFLQEIKKDGRFSDIPVVVFTSSGLEKDSQDSKKLGVDYYIRKPLDLDDFAKAIEEIEGLFTN